MLAFLLLAQPCAAMTPRDLAAARRWIVSVYRTLPYDTRGWYDVALAPELKSLARREDRASPGLIDVVDADPFCSCQDTAADYRVLRSSVARLGPERARVTILLRNGTVQRFVVDVVRAPHGGFAVADIHPATMPSLVASLRRAVRSYRR